MVRSVDNMQQWCAGCATVREFVLVPDSDPTEYACIACDAALVASGAPTDQARAAALV